MIQKDVEPIPRPRFSLRTLLVFVTLVCFTTGWLVYQFRWIRQRHEALKGVSYVSRMAKSPAPPLLRMFGEDGIAVILIPCEDAEFLTESRKFKNLFPEAQVQRQVDLVAERDRPHPKRPNQTCTPLVAAR